MPKTNRVEHIGEVSHWSGEASTWYWRVHKYDADEPTLVTHEQVIKYCLDVGEIEILSCGCSYDCCGHVFTDTPYVVGYDNIHEVWIVCQSRYRNV